MLNIRDNDEFFIMISPFCIYTIAIPLYKISTGLWVLFVFMMFVRVLNDLLK